MADKPCYERFSWKLINFAAESSILMITTTSDYRVPAAHAAILLANLAWGLMSPISKDIMLSGAISPIALSGLRILGGAILFFLFSFILPESSGARQPIERRDCGSLLICSILMISANQGLFILGIGLTNPVDSSVMSAMTPILTMLLAAVILKFPITWMKMLGVGIGLAGVIALVSGSGQSEMASNPLLGDAMCLGAQLCAVIYYVVYRNVIMRYSPFTMMKWMFILSAFTYVPFCIPEMAKVDYANLPSQIWMELVYIVCFATFLSYLCIPFSQKYLRPTVVSMYNYLQPVTSAIAAVVLGVGTFGWMKALATLMIFSGVWLVNRSK